MGRFFWGPPRHAIGAGGAFFGGPSVLGKPQICHAPKISIVLALWGMHMAVACVGHAASYVLCKPSCSGAECLGVRIQTVGRADFPKRTVSVSLMDVQLLNT